MKTKNVIIILIVVAIVPLFFLTTLKDWRQVLDFSFFTTAWEKSIEESAHARLKYYSKPRSVIKLAALGAWKHWDGQNIKLKETIQFAFAKINSENEKSGLKYEIIWYDNNASTQSSDDLVRDIIKQEDIFGLIGTFQSSTNAIIKAKVAKAKLLHLSMTQGDVDLLVPRLENYFSATVSVEHEAQSLATWSREKFGKDESFFLVREDDLYSRKFGDSIFKMFHRAGLNIIGSLFYEKSNTTGHVERYLSDYLAFEPNLKIMLVGNVGTYLDFYKYNEPLVAALKSNDFIVNQESVNWKDFNLLPSLKNSYIISTIKYDERFTAVLKELQELYGLESEIYLNIYAYRLPFILADAVKMAQSNDINKVVRYMNDKPLATPLGEISFNEQGFIENTPINIIRAQEIYDFLKEIAWETVK